MVLTGSFALSQVTGLSCHLRLRGSLREAWRQRRGVRTTRLRRPQTSALVSSAARVHRIPTLRSWRSRNAPLCGPGRQALWSDLGL